MKYFTGFWHCFSLDLRILHAILFLSFYFKDTPPYVSWKLFLAKEKIKKKKKKNKKNLNEKSKTKQFPLLKLKSFQLF